MGGTPASDSDGWPTDDADKSGFWPTDERWRECERCGWLYPDSETLIEEHTGLRVCKKDWDDDPYHEKHHYANTFFPFDPEYTEE